MQQESTLGSKQDSTQGSTRDSVQDLIRGSIKDSMQDLTACHVTEEPIHHQTVVSEKD